MKISAAGLTTVAVVFWSSFATAGPVADAATRAEALQAQGKITEALDALDAAMETICDASPLVFRQVVVVDSSEGYGVYSERMNKTFKPDEKLLVYVEPVCLGEGAKGALGFKADLAIENMTGQVLGEAKDVFSISTTKRRDFSTTLSFGVPYLRPGEYNAAFTVRDQNSDKTGTFEVPFTIGLPTAN
jgi:hypothetical protein